MTVSHVIIGLLGNEGQLQELVLLDPVQSIYPDIKSEIAFLTKSFTFTYLVHSMPCEAYYTIYCIHCKI